MSWTDEEIDQLFRDRANDLSFEYKPAYWEEFSSSLSSLDLGGMSGETHEVDQLYQLSANELTFEYKDAYWKEVEGMLPRRRRPDFLWFGTALIFLGALTVGGFTSDTPAEEQALQANTEVQAVAGSQDEVQVPVSESHAPAVVNEPDFVSLDLEGIVPNNVPLEFAGGNETYTPENGGRVPENELRAENPVDVPVPLDENLENTTPIENQMVNPLVIGNDTGDGNDGVPEITVGDPLHLEAQNIAHTAEDIEQGEIGVLATRNLPGTASQTLAESNLPAVYDFKLPLSTGLYLELNGGLSQSLITPSSSISFSGGLGIGARFQKGRFLFNTGINGQIAFHDDITLNRQAKVYGFGSEVYRYTLKYDQMYNVEAVLSAGYRFGPHQITVGIRPSYLVGTKVGVTLLEEEVESDRKTVYGHTEGLKRFGLKPTLGYAVDLKSNFTLGLNLGVQTMKLVEEEFISGKNNTLPLDLQIYIRKGLRFRK